MTAEQEMATTGVSRRALIKKAAVAGGIAWVAPTVLANPAFAANACGCLDTQLFALKFQNNSQDCTAPGANPRGDGNCLARNNNTNFRDGCCLKTAGLITGPTYGPNTATFTLASGLTFCSGFSKCGPNCLGTATSNVVATTNQNGTTTVVFNCVGVQEGLSHLELLVCVNGTAIPAGCPTTPVGT